MRRRREGRGAKEKRRLIRLLLYCTFMMRCVIYKMLVVSPPLRAFLVGEQLQVHQFKNKQIKSKMAATGEKEAFFKAIAKGDLNEVKTLHKSLGEKAKTLRHEDSHEKSPLHWAALHNQVLLVDFFLQEGHDKNATNALGSTPVLVAAEKGHGAVVDLLAEQGADVNKPKDGNATPVYMAAQNGHAQVLPTLAKKGADLDTVTGGMTPLVASLTWNENDDSAALKLIELGADVNKAGDNGMTPLICAATNNHGRVAELLVQKGAAKDKASRGGTTPLMAACCHGHMAVATILLDNGCNGDLVDNRGRTALHWAAARGDVEVAQVLFRHGVKLDVRDNHGRTPADLATELGHHAVTDALRAEEIRRRDHGFKRDPSTIEGTEEHEAAKRPRVEEEAESEGDDDDDDDDDDEVEEEA
jgi:ankyrin repeat protein